jgi:hypothetical protein
MDAALKQQIVSILEAGRDLTLATVRPDGAPQATTVSYASDGLVIYFGCGAASQKASNLERDGRVSLTVDLPYADWNHIRGLSLFGQAERLAASDYPQIGRLFAGKFPQMAQHQGGLGEMVVYRIRPRVVSVLDYRKGFGHSELVAVDAADLNPERS